ncbi:MAG TPA: response regulator transcription factor [Chthoniobacteraceae bacterium]|jgi:two-component system NarL family response regulator
MKPEASIRLALIDDHLFLRVGLASMLESQPDMTVVAEAGSAEEALTKCADERPDIAIMDLRMGGMGGIECTASLRHAVPETKVIILTTFDSDENLFRALHAGAYAFLLKDVPKLEFLETIRAVHAGSYRLPPAIAERVAERLREEPLSDREIEILRRIAAGRSNKEIGVDLSISESTVKGHINRILSKLHAHDRTEAVVVALKRGLIAID